MENLKKILSRLDGRGYKAYKELRGSYEFPQFTLYIDHVQGDPFASPSKVRARVAQDRAGFETRLFCNRSRRIALQDYVTRAFDQAIKNFGGTKKGSGKSGLITIDCGRQKILERTSSRIDEENVEVYFYVGLPARGRRILGDAALSIFTQQIPKMVESSMFFSSLEKKSLESFIDINEDQDHLRKSLKEKGLAAFIAEGSILPRRSGVSDKPLSASEAVSFKSPPELNISLSCPNRGSISGMGIPFGITLIIGGGFHGKTTLLSAIQEGIYNHVPGDGREYVISLEETVKIRAEEGRYIQKTDISPFISNLPFGKNTVKFSTANASGSTSQAANIIEALECKAGLLLLDEDTSATNFLIRDEIMQKIVSKDKEPITPLIDQVENMYEQHGASTILVMGGSGDYFEVADQVILMDSYRPLVVTPQAKRLVGRRKDIRKKEAPPSFGKITERVPQPESINPYKGRKKKIKSRGMDSITFGFEDIDLSSIEQIVDPSQLNAVSQIIYYAVEKKHINGKNTLCGLLEKIFEDIKKDGLSIISPYRGHPGSYALPRRFEVAAALNRLRSLKVSQV